MKNLTKLKLPFLIIFLIILKISVDFLMLQIQYWDLDYQWPLYHYQVGTVQNPIVLQMAYAPLPYSYAIELREFSFGFSLIAIILNALILGGVIYLYLKKKINPFLFFLLLIIGYFIITLLFSKIFLYTDPRNGFWWINIG